MKDNSGKQAHWNHIFRDKPEESLGWYEQDVSYTLDFFPEGILAEPQTIFIAGAGTSQLVDGLLAMGHRLILNDISDAALAKLRGRIGKQDAVIWLAADLSQALPDDLPPVDIWIDRAVLHFLIDEQAIKQYFASLNRLVKSAGFVLLAEFAETGAERCAGLPVHRYSLAAMNRRMLPVFSLLKHAHYDYITPAGGNRPYLYALYQRN
ncbi:MAG: methyltransferase domain-containing protein [Proteobacteria bacterium]|nr:MAG: methyltransferase domain-containing protein [Pseudomonadota bacterium]